MVHGYDPDSDLSFDNIKRCLLKKLRIESAYLLDDEGVEVTSVDQLLSCNYFLVSDRAAVRNLSEMKLDKYFIRHEDRMPLLEVKCRALIRASSVEDMDLLGLPPLWKMEENLEGNFKQSDT